MDEDGSQRPFMQKINNVDTAVPKYIIHEITSLQGEKLRIGFLGVVLPFNKQPYVHYDDVITTFNNSNEELKKHSDLQIAITHLNLEDDMALAEAVEGIPLFVGGHEHEKLSRYVNRTIIAKADANAKTVYIHRITFDPNSGMTSIQSEIKVIDESIPDEPVTKAIVDKWVNKAFVTMKEMGYKPDRQVLKLEESLDCKEHSVRTKQTNYGDLAMQAMKRALPGGHLYIMNAGSMRLDDEIHNLVTEYDVLRSFPLGGKLVRMKLPGAVVKEIMEIGTKINYGEGGFFQYFYNTELPLDPTKEYDIVLPEFVAQGREANLELLKNYKFYNSDEKFVVEGVTVRNDIRDLLIHHMLQIKQF